MVFDEMEFRESLKDEGTIDFIERNVEGGVDSWVQFVKDYYQYGL
jgi:hypothetical protein